MTDSTIPPTTPATPAELAVVVSRAIHNADAELHDDQQRAERARMLATEAMHAHGEGRLTMARYLATRAVSLHPDHYAVLCDALAVPDSVLASEVGEAISMRGSRDV